MAACINGMVLHGGFRPFGSTFLVFADYLRPALRLSALMRIPAIYVLTHDSIAVGEDGPTHEPIEHIESLRAIPNLQVLRPYDDADTARAWRQALERLDGPTALILSRQNLPQLDPAAFTSEDATVEIVATGSEVSVALGAAEILRAEDVPTRVVPVLDRSDYAPTPDVTTVSVEAGATSGWNGVVDLAIGIDTFGDSGKGDEVMAHHGFTPEKVADRIRECLAD
jgi:transketolase